MPITGKYFPSQRSEEKVFLLLRRHWITYSIFPVLFVLMAVPLVVAIILLINSTEPLSPVLVNALFFAVPAYILIMIGLMLYGFVDYYLDVYIVTNERIVEISQNGFFKRKISELHLRQVQDVSASETGAFSTLFHYGEIQIQTAGEQENFTFRSIPHPYAISKKILDLHETQLAEAQKQEEDVGSDSGEFSNEFKPEVLSIARKRTKEFFRGNEPLDAGVGSDEIVSLSAQNKSDSVISGIERTKDETATLEEVNVNNSQQENKPAKVAEKSESPEKNKGESVELHENEEIDL